MGYTISSQSTFTITYTATVTTTSISTINQTPSLTSTMSSTVSSASCTETAHCRDAGEPPNGGYFVVQVNYSGTWTAVITTYSAFADNSSYLHTMLCFNGSGNVTTIIQTWNPNGEESTWVTAKKLDSTNANLTVSVGYGSFYRNNSTTDSIRNYSNFCRNRPLIQLKTLKVESMCGFIFKVSKFKIESCSF